MSPKWVKSLATKCAKKVKATTQADTSTSAVTYTIRRRDMLDTDSSSSEDSSSRFIPPSDIDIEEALRHHGLYCRTKTAIKKLLHIKGKKSKGKGKAPEPEDTGSRVTEDAPRLLVSRILSR